MAENIRDEIKRLHRKKQLTNNALERMQDSESSGSEMGSESPRRPDSPQSLTKHPEKGLFTFKQVLFNFTTNTVIINYPLMELKFQLDSWKEGH